MCSRDVNQSLCYLVEADDSDDSLSRVGTINCLREVLDGAGVPEVAGDGNY
jgi:hypothetical protein